MSKLLLCFPLSTFLLAVLASVPDHEIEMDHDVAAHHNIEEPSNIVAIIRYTYQSREAKRSVKQDKRRHLVEDL